MDFKLAEQNRAFVSFLGVGFTCKVSFFLCIKVPYELVQMQITGNLRFMSAREKIRAELRFSYFVRGGYPADCIAPADVRYM